jgi:hypothetical protein
MAQGIPQVLIQPLRVALQSQGFPPEMVRDDGTLNSAGLLATVYTDIEFRSALWPTQRVATRGLLHAGPPSPFLQWVKPTVVLRGGGQETIIAPYGVHAGGTVLPLAGVALGLIGLGYVLAKV